MTELCAQVPIDIALPNCQAPPEALSHGNREPTKVKIRDGGYIGSRIVATGCRHNSSVITSTSSKRLKNFHPYLIHQWYEL